MSTPTIFISYNGADHQWAEWIGWHLEDERCSVTLQDWDFRPGANFVLSMDETSRDSDRTLLSLSDHFLKAVFTSPEWAAVFRRDPLGEIGKLYPVRVANCSPDGLLGPIVYVDLVGLDEDQARTAPLDGLEERGKPAEQPAFPESSIPDDARTITSRPPHPAKIRVTIARLPTTGPHLLGRDDQLAQLTAAWEADHTHVLSIVAPGGAGKTALVNRWLGDMATAGATEPDPTPLAQATEHLDRGVDGLRQSGQLLYLPWGLLARAALHRVTADQNSATRDLDEVFEIAERGGMRLHLADSHLERARLRVSLRQTEEARKDLEAAQALVEETEYRRREPEVAALAGVVGNRSTRQVTGV